MLRSLFSGLLLLTSFILPASLLSRQSLSDGESRWSEFTTESGLPSDHIYLIAETKDGTTWVATAAGYAWYDGYRWNLADSSTGLKSARAWAIGTFGRDSLIANHDADIFVGNTHGFRRLPIDSANRVLPLSDTSLLVRRGAFLSVLRNGILEPFRVDTARTNGKTFEILSSRGEHPYLVLESGMYRVDGSHLTCIIPATDGRVRVNLLAENDAGTLIAMIGTPISRRGLVQIRGDQVSVIRAWQTGNYAIAADVGEGGEIVVATESGGLDLIRDGVTTHLEIPFQGFRTIEYVHFAPNGNLWVGTNHGLFLYRKTVPPWSYMPRDSMGAKNRIHEILRTSNGDLWAATAYGLMIFRKDGRKESVEKIDNKLLTEVTGLIEDDDGNIWISGGASFTGAYRLDAHGWHHFPVSDDPAGVHFHKIRKDRHGRLWFLGLSESSPLPGATEPGAYLYENGKFTHYGVDSGLASGHVYAFDEGLDGSRVFGTLHGACRWKNGKWEYWNPSQGFAGWAVFALAIDSSGTAWLCNRNDGVCALLPDGRRIQYTTHDGLVDNAVWDVRIGPDGRIWFATDDGLSCYDHGNWSYYNARSGLIGGHLWPVLPLEDRVYVGTQFAGVAALNLEASQQAFPRIYLDKPIVEGTSVHLRWSTSMPWNEIPQRDIYSRLRLDNQPWSPWSMAHTATFDGLSAGGHEFEVQSKNLFGTFDPQGAEIGFSVPPPIYRRPEFLVPVVGSTLASLGFAITYLRRKRKHAAALQASEAKFRRLTEATFEGVIIHDGGRVLDANQSILHMLGYTHSEFVGTSAFSFLAPETREAVERIAMSDSGVICEAVGIKKDGSRIPIEVIGKTIPFDNHSAGVTAVRDITERKRAEEKLMAYQSQLRSLALELEATEERERRRMATYLHDYIGQSLALCKIKLGAVPAPALPTHQLAHLQEIRALLEQMILNTQSLTFELSPPVLYELGFEDALEWLTEQIERQHGIKVGYENDDEPKPLREEVKILLFHAVRELLVNVVKHAYAKNARVSLRKSTDKLEVTVQDDGIGLKEPAGEAGRSSGRPLPAKHEPGKGGFGLFNIRERITPLGGRIYITSTAGMGTRVVLRVPLLSEERDRS